MVLQTKQGECAKIHFPGAFPIVLFVEKRVFSTELVHQAMIYIDLFRGTRQMLFRTFQNRQTQPDRRCVSNNVPTTRTTTTPDCNRTRQEFLPCFHSYFLVSNTVVFEIFNLGFSEIPSKNKQRLFHGFPTEYRQRSKPARIVRCAPGTYARRAAGF